MPATPQPPLPCLPCPALPSPQLSGGERSYTTVAFTLALGGQTEMPFRAMDEFVSGCLFWLVLGFVLV